MARREHGPAGKHGLKPPVRTIEWRGNAVRILDQTLLPAQTKYLDIRTAAQMWEAIRALRVRGAPAIGVAAAYGLYLGTAARKPSTGADCLEAARAVADYLATARPTAVNLFWALSECLRALKRTAGGTTGKAALETLLEAAKHIHRDDEERCAAIARNGAPLLAGLTGVQTHCNAGALATAGVGTALGVILEAAKTNRLTVHVDETRPLLQGARLTAWELERAAIPYRLQTDSMAASAMARGLVQAVITGADRIAANGDAANKIGTLPLAICARFYRIPFYIAAPLSTVDFLTPNGRGIPIEERPGDEVTALAAHAEAPRCAETFNPAFDVVPNRLITAIITEAGIARRPFSKSLNFQNTAGRQE
ncbi:S-methyl-5-thioribose-1-phosphate isomerase [Candidatus Poribacteria bacterium]|nr:S-methyl-5-thioribose-1-phosphate isomerase [Candidatus Poribacteria bacterium]